MKKILAVMLALTLVLALVPAVALAEGTTVNITTSAELETAIANQAPGQTWNIAAGVYDISRNMTISYGGQTGWYFPIVQNGITINGAGTDKTVITSSKVSRNGSWASQNMFAIAGDDVTVQDLTVRPKIDTNKAFEVMGRNVTLRNIDILHNNVVTHEDYCAQLGIAVGSDTDYWEGYTSYFAGSIFFNPQNSDKDIGTATLDNVLVTQAWISCGTSYVSAGTLNLTGGTTIDFRGSWYAGYRPDLYRVISKNPDVINAVDFTIIYDELADEQQQIFEQAPLGTTLVKDTGTDVTAAVSPTYTIIIPASVDFGTMVKGSSLVTKDFSIVAQDVVIEAGAHIDVNVQSEFKMSDGATPPTWLGYSLYNQAEGGSKLSNNAEFASFTASGPKDGRVTVDTSAITKAGSYSGTMVFTITYID